MTTWFVDALVSVSVEADDEDTALRNARPIFERVLELARSEGLSVFEAPWDYTAWYEEEG